MLLNVSRVVGSVGNAITRSLTELEQGLHGYSVAAEAALGKGAYLTLVRVSGRSECTLAPETADGRAMISRNHGPASAAAACSSSAGGKKAAADIRHPLLLLET